MTENESLKIMLAYKLGRGCKPHYSDEEIEKAFDTAISALQEIQQYREIGTVEECREAVEKQKPKKPKLNYKPRFLGKATYTCPKCGNCCLEEFANERQNNNYCWDCGQAIRWDENLEETENEQIKFGVLL